MKDTQYNDLTDIQKKLLDSAEKAMEHSYDPYSGFSVGAALLTKDGSIVTGSNMENASSSLSICAERAAIINAGMPKRLTPFKEVAHLRCKGCHRELKKKGQATGPITCKGCHRPDINK